MFFKLIFSFFILQISFFAVDFDDLKEKQGKIYGSEKDEKYVYDAFFSELESWPKQNPTHSSFHFFWIFNSTDYPKYSKSQFFPFYSIEKSKVDKREQNNYFYLVNNETELNGDEFSYFLPFYFISKNKNSSNLFLPLILSNFSDHESKNTKTNTTFTALFYKTETKNEQANFLESTNINPFYYSYQTKIKSNSSSVLFFPIIPLIYSSNDDENSRKNFFWLLDYETEKDSISRFFFLPFYYFKKNDYNIIFPIYYSFQKESGANSTLIPIIYYSENKKDKSSIKNFLLLYHHEFNSKDELTHFNLGPYLYKKNSYNLLLPIYFSWENLVQNKKEESSLFFPIYYRNKIQDGNTYTNLFGLFSYESDVKSDRVGTQIFPFYFYKKNSYSILFPFIFRFGPESEKAKIGKIFGLFYYNSWDENEDTNLIFNYYSNNEKNGDYFKTIFPVYFSSKTGSSETLQSLLFYHTEDKKNGDCFKTFFPVFFSWKSNKSDGSLFFPFYLNIDYPNKTNFNLNLFGLAGSSSKGIYTPDINLDLGKKDSYSYLDTDISWLYNIVKLETRISTKIIEDIKEKFDFKDTKKEEKISNSSPKIQKKKDFTRENSYNFYGFNFLFSALSYEVGDSKKHFRLLPFAWLTWDKESEDKLIAVPFYIYFKDLESEYRVIFPLYGKQKTPQEKRTAYGLFIYIDEEYKEKNLKEKSILWPLFNSYSSDENEGSRLIPFYHYKKTWDGKEIKSRTISLAYFSNYYKNNSGIETDFIFSPFFIYNFDKKNENIDSYHFSIPIYYKSYSQNAKSNFHKFISIPFYYSSEFEKGKQDLKSVFWTFPVLAFRNRENDEINWNILLFNNYFHSPRKNNLFLGLVYYHNMEYEKEKHFLTNRILFPFFNYERNIPREDEKYDKLKFYSILFNYSSSEEKNTLDKSYDYLIPPLLFYGSINPEKNYYNFAVIFSFEKFKKTEERNFYFTPLISMQTNSNLNRNYFLPIYYFSKKPNETYFGTFIFSYQNENLGTTKDISYKLPILFPFIYYQNSISDSRSWNILSIFYIQKELDSVSHGIFPIYHKKTNKNKDFEENLNYLAPFYYYGSFDSPELKKTNFTTIIFSREEEISEKKNKTEYNFPSFIPILFYLEKEYNFSNWNLLSLIYRRKEKDFSSYGLFPLFRNSEKTANNYLKSNSYFFPIYYFSSDNSETGKKNNFTTIFFSRKEISEKKNKTEYNFPSFVPILFYLEKENNFSNWNLLSLIYSRNSLTSNSFGLFPVFGKKSKETSLTSYFFPIYYSYSEETKDLKASELITILFLYKSNIYKNKEFKLEFPAYIPFLYNYDSENEKKSWNLLSFIYSRELKFYSSTGFIPFYHFSDSKDQNSKIEESYSYFFPYFQYEDKNTLIRNFCGILFNQYKSKFDKENSVSILYPLVNVKTSSENKFRYQNLFGLIEYNSAKDSSDFNFFWFGYKNHPDSSHLNLFPIYYSKNEYKEKSKLILPFLTYTKESDTEEFQSTALSILYHSKKDLVTKEEDVFWLLGILYYKIKRPSERGYEGEGSLWGVLWEYKTESETNYKKFSILKVITLFKETK